jgi:hypothetical protein
VNSAKDFVINPRNKNNDPVFEDANLFQDDFDRTWMRWEQEGNYSREISLGIGEPQEVDDGTVLYSYNNEGFRSEDFSETHNGAHILFAGCSQTEGIGSPINTVWSKMLHEELSHKNKLSNYFSIARSGYGWQKIILNFIKYAEKYEYPDYLFVLLPNVGRLWEWDPEANRWWYIQRYPNGQGLEDLLDKKNYFSEKPLSVEEHRKLFIDFVAGWKIFERLCEDNGVKLLWASWDQEENKNYLSSGFSKNYIHLSNEEFLQFIEKERPDGKIQEHDMKRRDGHDGILFHNYWLSKFIERIKAEKFFPNSLGNE